MKKIKHNQYDLGYFAGIVEGEGCFSLNKSKTDNGLDIVLSVTSESIQLIQWLYENFKGSVRKEDSTRCFSWTARKDDILEVLKQIKNKLLFKKQQCETAIKIMENLKKPYSGTPLTDEEIKERESLYFEHRKILNSIHETKKIGKRKGKIFLALSGGMDSTTLLYYLKWTGAEIETYSLDYGQKHSKELEKAKEIAEIMNVKHSIIKLDKELVSGSTLTSDKEVPEGYYTDKSMRQTVVPGRNLILLSIASVQAIMNNCDAIAIGAHASDSIVYPDCRSNFLTMAEQAIQLGNYHQLKLLAPFMTLTKADIAFLGHLLEVPFEKTWSCYNGQERPCLKCGTCTERVESFIKMKIKDPLLSDDEWQDAVSYYNLIKPKQ